MTIRGIIDAARPYASDPTWQNNADTNEAYLAALERFSELFDPDHVVLVEAVVEASMGLRASVGDMQDTMSMDEIWRDRLDELAAYRSERGLL